MRTIENLLAEVNQLDWEESKRVAQALLDHLEELDDIAAYDQAKSSLQEVVSLEEVLARYNQESKS